MENMNLTVAVPEIPLDERGALKPNSFAQLWYIAKIYASSDMCPKSYKGKPGDIIIAWEKASALNINRALALESIAVINGISTVFGDAALAIGLASPETESVVETYEGSPYLPNGKENDDFKAVCTVSLKNGRPPVVRDFSVRDAKNAKLWMKRGQNGGDTPWVGYWRRMLSMRARAWALRDAVPGALKGMHLQEEIEYEPSLESKQLPERVFTSPGPSQKSVDMAETAGPVVDAEFEPQPAAIPELPQESTGEPQGEARAVPATDSASWLEDPNIVRLVKDIGVNSTQAEEFIKATAKENDLPIDDVRIDMARNYEAYAEQAVIYFDLQRSVPAAAPHPEPTPAQEPPPVEEDPQTVKENSEASLIYTLGSLSKAAFEKVIKNPKIIAEIESSSVSTKAQIGRQWVSHKLGPCPFFQEQPALPLKDGEKPAAPAIPGKLPLVPADYPQSPERKYSFALANARKQTPDLAETAREELGFGRLVMSEDGAKRWYEKIVEIQGRPPVKKRGVK